MSRHFLTAVACTILATACQSGGRTPLAPAGSEGQSATPPVPTNLATVTGSAEGLTAVNEVGWLHTLTIRATESGALESALDPLRTAEAKGDAYQLDGTGFFQDSPCHDCLEVTGLKFASDGDVLVSVALTHPFPMPPQPYTSLSRLDLHAFDVMGFVLTEGLTPPLAFGSGKTVAGEILTNADGYTNLYDSVIEPFYPTPNVTEHPYRVFFRDDSAGNFSAGNINGFADLRDPQGHNTMAMGESDTVEFKLHLEPGQSELRVGLAIGLAWGQGGQGKGAILGQRQNPIYYLPEFHNKAPWTVTASLSDNTLQEGNPMSTATVEVRLRDWQRGATVAAPFEFGVTPPDQTLAASDVASLTITIPGLVPTPIVLDPQNPISGTGVADDAVWWSVITNSQGVVEGTYWAWVEAIDQRQPTATSGLDRDINFFQPGDFHTGYLLEIEVGEASTLNTPPTATLSPDPALGAIGHPVLFDASASTDLESPADLTFEFDYNLLAGDPGNFTPAAPPSTDPLGQFQYCPTGAYFAAVRVTDPEGLTDIAVVPVTITSFLPQPVVMVLASETHSLQTIWSGNFSGEDRLAIAGSHVYALVYDDAEADDSDYAHRLMVSSDGGASFIPGAVIDQSYAPAGTLDTWVWGDMFLLASPDGTVYVMGQQARPDFYNTQLNVWTSDNFGADPFVVRHTDTDGQKYSLCGAVDPLDPAHVILSYSRGTCNFRTLTTNAGSSALGTGADLPGQCDGGFGASLFFAPNSRVYHCSVRFDAAGLEGGYWVRRSDDNGNSWPPENEFTRATGQGISTVFASGRGMADPTDATGLSMAFACRFNNAPNIGVCLFTTSDGGQNIDFKMNLDDGNSSDIYPGARYYPTGEMMVYWTTYADELKGITSCDNGQSFSPVQTITPIEAGHAYIVDKPGTPDFGALFQPFIPGAGIAYRQL